MDNKPERPSLTARRREKKAKIKALKKQEQQQQQQQEQQQNKVSYNQKVFDEHGINIIDKTKFSIVEDFLNQYDKAVIFGKGPTFTPLKKLNNKTAFICINNTINYMEEEIDLLVCNDLESLSKLIDKSKLTLCKNILIPFHIHVKNLCNRKYTYTKVVDVIKSHFKGNLIIHNIISDYVGKKAKQSNLKLKKNNKYIELTPYAFRATSVHTAFEFIGKFIKKIKMVDFYGFILNSNSNETTITFYKNKKHKSCTKHNKFKNKYKNIINKISEHYKLPYKLN